MFLRDEMSVVSSRRNMFYCIMNQPLCWGRCPRLLERTQAVNTLWRRRISSLQGERRG
jgi:hypothetical protein